ncbi:MAG: hypothetical protein GMKNLPBB_01499 [Myxococcota bacterium]|nr:hypothetical protein [Myxococcota bacterium]
MRSSFILFLAAALLAPLDVHAQNANEIIRKTDAIMAPALLTMELVMDVERTSGEHRVYGMLIQRRDENTRVFFLAPPVEKGRKMLRRNDDIWMLLPNVKRPVRVSAKQELMGGDFNNSDVLRLSLVRDYNPKILSETAEYWELELKAKDRSITYDRVIARIGKKDYLPIQFHYFTESGKKVRELSYSNVMKVGETVIPATWTMFNNITNRKSVASVKSFEPGKTADPNDFLLERM